MCANKDIILKNKSELLSPAGSLDSAYAAFHYGADAVYFGLKSFSARAEAENLSENQAEEIISYAHSLSKPKKVYLALNTLVFDSELDQLIETLAWCHSTQIDAVIVQDIGVARMLRDYFPTLTLHASTQLAVHNLEGVLACTKLGFSRVTLARELSIHEIKEILQHCDTEIECFIHGSLCYSYSGLCLFSSHCYSRSANRGNCAYPCREVFRKNVDDEYKRYFSMKDLALEKLACSLQEIGVHSLKIEGRMKSPLFTAAATDYYRSVLNGCKDIKLLNEKLENLRTVYARPYTKLYFQGEIPTDVTNQHSSGHLGLLVGNLQTITIHKNNKSIVFRTKRELELHDGLQIFLPESNRVFGFSVTEIQICRGQRKILSFQARCNDIVQVPLPKEAPHIPLNAEIYCASSQKVKQMFKFFKPKAGEFKIRCAIAIEIYVKNQSIHIKADVINNTYSSRIGHTVPIELQSEKTKGQGSKNLILAFNKLGDTEFTLNKLSIENPDSLFISPSLANTLRRETCTALSNKLKEAASERLGMIKSEILRPSVISSLSFPTTRSWIIRIEYLSYLAALKNDHLDQILEVLIDLETLKEDEIKAIPFIAKELPCKLRVILPTILRSSDRATLTNKVKFLISKGVTNYLANNIYSTELLKQTNTVEKQLDIAADSSLYSLNSQTVLSLLKQNYTYITTSTESNINSLATMIQTYPSQILCLLYQHTSLFISATCINKHYKCKSNCENCDITFLQELSSAKNNKYFSKQQNGRTIVFAKSPFDITSELHTLEELGATMFRLDFINKEWTAEEIKTVIEKVLCKA